MKYFLPAVVILLLGAFLFLRTGGGEAQLLGRTAPDFNAPDLNGSLHKLADYRGKVVIVDFWATWCPPCRAEMPGFQKLYEKYRDRGLEVLAVNVSNEPRDKVAAFAREHKIAFPILLGPEAEKIQKDYGNIRSIPTSFIIDRQGILRRRMVGYHSPEDFEKDLSSLLEKR